MSEPLAKRRSQGVRNLAILAGLAALSALIAAAAVVAGRAPSTGAFAPEPAFPNLETGLAQADALRIQTSEERFHIDFDPDAGWRVRERFNYPADLAEVRRTLIGLAELDFVAKRTANPAWHGALDLETPAQGGAGLRLSVLGAEEDAPIAELILGETAAGYGGFGDARRRLYVRRPGEAQTWLAEGRLDPPRRIAAWLALGRPEIARADIASLRVSPAAGESYVVSRADADQDVFDVAPPEGRSLRSETAANSAAFAVTELNFTDVRPASDMPETAAAEVEIALFDDAEVLLRLFEVGEDRWVSLAAVGGPKAEALSAQLGGWAYKISAYQYDRLAPPLEDLLAPLPEATATEDDADAPDEAAAGAAADASDPAEAPAPQ